MKTFEEILVETGVLKEPRKDAPDNLQLTRDYYRATVNRIVLAGEKYANQQTLEYIETLRGVTKALQRVLDKHDPDSIEYEWVGEANEIILKATGKNLRE